MPNTRSTSPRIGARIVALALWLAPALAAAAPLLPWTLAAEYPHETGDFTQGLVWGEGRMFESTGQYGESRLAEKRLKDGRTLRSRKLPRTEFGEGLALLRGELWQLTWRDGRVYVYGLDLRPRRQFETADEGWGLASDGRELVRSDGSATLRFVDPKDFNTRRTVAVRDGDRAVTMLNELEWFGGAIYANVWLTDRVARIDPASGAVTGWLDFGALVEKAGITDSQRANGAVLNGLAWRDDTRQLLVTGKRWPRLYAVTLESPAAEKK